jgi:hypothetical protein
MTIDDNNNRQELAPPSAIRQVGQWGNGPVEFWCPSGLVITRDHDHLIVVDSWNHRLQVNNYIYQTKEYIRMILFRKKLVGL